MIRKDVILGFIYGLIANLTGIAIVVLFRMQKHNEDFFYIINEAISNRVLGKFISLGALLNLILFFIFIKKNQDHKARGVLLITLLAAIIVIINKV